MNLILIRAWGGIYLIILNPYHILNPMSHELLCFCGWLMGNISSDPIFSYHLPCVLDVIVGLSLTGYLCDIQNSSN